MADDDNETGFEGLGDALNDTDQDDVDRPTEEEFEEMSPVELRRKYGSVADFYVPEEGDE